MFANVDTFILGRKMYPDYERYWTTILADPSAVLPISGRPPTPNEITYARLADKTPHVVVSKTLDKVAWRVTRIVRDVEDVRKLKRQPGKDMQVVGGATLVSSLVNAGLVDEFRLTVNPIVLGRGTSLFKDVAKRRELQFVRAKPLSSGKVVLTYTAK